MPFKAVDAPDDRIGGRVEVEAADVLDEVGQREQYSAQPFLVVRRLIPFTGRSDATDAVAKPESASPVLSR